MLVLKSILVFTFSRDGDLWFSSRLSFFSSFLNCHFVRYVLLRVCVYELAAK